MVNHGLTELLSRDEIEKQRNTTRKKVAVIGSRTITDYVIVKSILERYLIYQLVSGGAKGVDSLAERYSHEMNLVSPQIFIPNRDAYGKDAPFVRNREIVDYADQIVAIWDGKSTGTTYTVNYAKSKFKDIDVWLLIKDGIIKRDEYYLTN